MPGEDERVWTIGDLSRELNVTPRALRFYEDKGLISPKRRGVQRLYSARDRGRVVLILRWKRFGFTLDEIKHGLDLYDLPDHGETQLRATLARAREQLAGLRGQREDLDQIIADLEATCAEIERRLAAIDRDAAA